MNIYLLLDDSFSSIVKTQNWTILSIIGSVKGLGKMKDLENNVFDTRTHVAKAEIKNTIYGYTVACKKNAPSQIC